MSTERHIGVRLLRRWRIPHGRVDTATTDREQDHTKTKLRPSLRIAPGSFEMLAPKKARPLKTAQKNPAGTSKTPSESAAARLSLCLRVSPEGNTTGATNSP